MSQLSAATLQRRNADARAAHRRQLAEQAAQALREAEEEEALAWQAAEAEAEAQRLCDECSATSSQQLGPES
eukprot:5270789-Heterocapsa_arctica.AAC.1